MNQIVSIVHRSIRHSLVVVASTFAIFAILAAAFECTGNAPTFWLYTPRACSHGGLQYTILTLSLITDLWIATVALPIIWKLQIVPFIRLRAMALLGS